VAQVSIFETWDLCATASSPNSCIVICSAYARFYATLAEPQHSPSPKTAPRRARRGIRRSFLHPLRCRLDKNPEIEERPQLHLFPIGKRIWIFVCEVLFQTKVIRQRPRRLAHAFVFWGFCAFVLVTLNHFAAGLPRLPERGASLAASTRILPPSRLGLRGGHLGAIRPPFSRPAKWLGEKLSWNQGSLLS